MKSPKSQRPDDEAREATEKFIAKYAGKGRQRGAQAPPGRREAGGRGLSPTACVRVSVARVPEHAAALRAQLAYLERSSPFWRERLAGRADAVRCAADLPALPLTTKAELRADQAAHPPFGARLCAPRAAPRAPARDERDDGRAGRDRPHARRPRREQRHRRRRVPHRRRAARRTRSPTASTTRCTPAASPTTWRSRTPARRSCRSASGSRGACSSSSRRSGSTPSSAR